MWTDIVSVLVSSRCPSELGLSSSSSVKVEEVEEGSEPTEFVKALGPLDKKAYDCMLQGATSHCILCLVPYFVKSSSHIFRG